MKAANILASAAKATSYNMLVQLSMRLMTFGLNAVILRYISKDLLGVVNVRLMLLYSTITFLTSEGFRRASLSHKQKREWRQVINLMWCTVPLGIMVTVVLSSVWYYVLERPDEALIPNYWVGVLVFGGCAWLEFLMEPLYVTGVAFRFIKLKVLTMGAWQALKCLVTLTLVMLKPDWGLYSFAAATVVSSVLYTSAYYLYFMWYISAHQKAKKDDEFPLKSMKDLLPRHVVGQPMFDKHLMNLTWSFTKQSFLKELLTEGERYVMTFFDVLTFAEQGIYDVINNLGSMVARFIFWPIEENAFFFFTQTLERGKSATEQTQDHMEFSTKVLQVLLKTVTLIGCIVVVFGYTNSFLALHIYGGNILSTGPGPTLLRWYCLYVLLLAINGVTEAFVFATMSKRQVDTYNQKMLVFSVLFLSAAWLLSKYLGSVGFILANCLNMTLRIAHSVYFIRKFFEKTAYKPLDGLLPSKMVCLTLVISLAVTAVSEGRFVSTSRLVGNLIHIGITGVCLLAVLAAIYFTETTMIRFIKEKLLQKPHAG